MVINIQSRNPRKLPLLIQNESKAFINYLNCYKFENSLGCRERSRPTCASKRPCLRKVCGGERN